VGIAVRSLELGKSNYGMRKLCKALVVAAAEEDGTVPMSVWQQSSCRTAPRDVVKTVGTEDRPEQPETAKDVSLLANRRRCPFPLARCRMSDVRAGATKDTIGQESRRGAVFWFHRLLAIWYVVDTATVNHSQASSTCLALTLGQDHVQHR
jgi:hypothetical protein